MKPTVETGGQDQTIAPGITVVENQEVAVQAMSESSGSMASPPATACT
jgi:hypothetical protein